MTLRSCLLPAALLVGLSAPAHGELVLPRVSPKATVTQAIGLTDLTLVYSRPGVKGRSVWGELVPYGKPWRTGANEATTFTASDDVQVGGQNLPAGTYSFFSIPAAGEWTLIFSRQKDLWGAFDYDSTQDALRIRATPTAAEHVEWMRIGFENLAPAGADLVVRWEKLQVAVPVTVEVTEKVLTECRREIAAAKADDWRTLSRSAAWCFDNDTHLVEGGAWLDRSLAIQAAYANLSLRARWLAKDGRKKEAIAAAHRAVAAGKASKDRVDTSATEKLIADWTAAK